MKLEYLAHNQQAIPIIAQWYFNQWGYLNKEYTLEKAIEEIQTYLNTDKIPLMIIAIENDEVVGVAQLKFREMKIFPEKEHWLGGVYVSKKHRGKDIAEKIIAKIVTDAKNLNVHILYLQTFNLTGGLYNRLGWKPIGLANNHGEKVLVMKRNVAL